ncbi:MAG: hypothetical protein HN742_25530 [Lentisphaerae bacterium]|jgi:uroporphyrinogen-III decarboxylase|nr:hypothetical protein [Lentisphaerota bacterium]MBT5612283.1 hypothetical protein [Lentisphaerota bacterium]MBT7060739.1 hypothetical protein [Lentisphaerota bacterium]MBT7845262.1 hypothetical protein [Lentisphaerota bacterium]
MSSTTAMSPMSTRDRIAATFRGDPVDHFPVWLKMANITWKSFQPEPYHSMEGNELLRSCGCDIMGGCSFPGTALRAEKPHVKTTVTRDGNIQRTVFKTPEGDLVGENSLDPATNTWHPTTYCAETLDEFRALRWCYTDTAYAVDAEAARVGLDHQRDLEQQDIYTMSGIGPSPIMHLVQHLCGPEAAIFHMVDDPKLFDEVVDLMHQDRVRHLAAILPHVPSDSFWLTENTTTTLISPTIFKDYCVPHLTTYGNMVLGHDLVPVHHMCGTLNAILEMIDELPAIANEAYTTRPVGDCSLAEGRTRMPSKALIGGTNASQWLKPAEAIIQDVAQDLAASPDRRKVFLTSAGVLPPQVSFEKAKQVVAGLKALPCD